jgi:hypothetical protein
MTESVAGFFDLPSVRALIQHVVTDLVEGKSVVVLLSHTASVQAVRDRIFADLERGRLDDFDWFDAAADEGVPEDLLCSAFCSSDSGLMPEDRLARLQKSTRNYYGSGRDHELPAVLFLDQLDQATAAAQERWVAFLERWQAVTRANRDTDRQPCRFCVVADASLLRKAPSEDVFLTIVHWWGVPSELEMELLCRTLPPADSNLFTFEQRWRGALLPVLAGGDPGLLEELNAGSPTVSKQLRDVLSGYCSRQGWPNYPHKGFCRDIANLIPTFSNEVSFVPPASAVDLWAAGLLVMSPERGVHVHPAYLCTDDAKWLDFFDWQAQQRAYFGLMEQGRFAVCRNITEVLGKGWASAVAPNDPNEEERIQRSDIYCGWGHLSLVLKQPWLAAFSNWIGPSGLAKSLRNKLAHAEPTPIENFKEYQTEMLRSLANGSVRHGDEKARRRGR